MSTAEIAYHQRRLSMKRMLVFFLKNSMAVLASDRQGLQLARRPQIT